MSETQTKAWALTGRGPSSSHVQPEELKGRSRPRLLLALGLPLGFGTVPVLLDYRGLKRTGEGEGGCFFLWKGLRRGTATSSTERLDPRHALWESDQERLSPKHNRWDLGFALLLSLTHTKARKEESVRRCSQTDIFPVISKRRERGTPSKDLAFTTFTRDFSFQSVSLSRSHFILSKYAKSVRTVYL